MHASTPPKITPFARGLSILLALGLSGFVQPQRSAAVVFFATGDPAVNTTAPTGTLAGSGWQYEGSFGAFLGTPIAPQFFLSAKHIGKADTVIVFGGQTYTLASGNGFTDPTPLGDLQIWQITGTFPSFAPMYSRKDEVGQPLVVIGRGTQRGGPVYLDSVLKGWGPGPADSVQRWGQNTVAGIAPYGTGNDLLYANFDQNGGPNESHLTSGDSGGAIFIQDGSVWKLAGINFAVDQVFVSNGSGSYSSLIAPLFDARGYYSLDSTNPPVYSLITDTAPVPTSFYDSRISTKLPWIYSVIDPTGSLVGDGVPNLLKYAIGFDVTVPATASPSTAGTAPGYATITYTKQTTATDLTFSIESSPDCTTWTTATVTNTILQTVGTVQTIQAQVALSGQQQLFLRLRVTRP